MKIACPQCGQHYEVEAGMLDRYFRCTECQMLFRGLNAKPVKERKFKRKNKVSDTVEAPEISGQNISEADPTTTSVAIAVEDMEKEAAEAEARFWEKSLEEDALAEKAVNYRKRTINWAAYLPVICIIMLAVTFVLAVLTNTKVNELSAGHKVFDNKGSEYKERLEKLEQSVETMQNSLQNITVSVEKLERVFEHINNKVNDQTLPRKVENLSQQLEKCRKIADEFKKVSDSVAQCREDIEKLSIPGNNSSKRR